MPRKCKFDNSYKCTYAACDERCPIFRSSGQQTFGKPEPKIIKIVKHKGITTKYYKVKK